MTASERSVRLTTTSKKLAAISQILDERIEADGAAHLALVRVAKVQEEAGEAMEAMIAYQHVNPRKPAGPVEDVIKELADVALTALVAIEHFGYDGEAELFERVRFVHERLAPAQAPKPECPVHGRCPHTRLDMSCGPCRSGCLDAKKGGANDA